MTLHSRVDSAQAIISIVCFPCGSQCMRFYGFNVSPEMKPAIGLTKKKFYWILDLMRSLCKASTDGRMCDAESFTGVKLELRWVRSVSFSAIDPEVSAS
ncbi:hypothetical protein BaRGS_00033651 [Batillaria attramentaria]|uniref:Uncharacterized protein n=1 Tax=Batillaria attramentaria TaxID=370345 RepID=A0ABD0JJH3_9CAEN